jgi:hypothetical protein
MIFVIPNRAESPVRNLPCFAEAPSEAEGEAEGNLLFAAGFCWTSTLELAYTNVYAKGICIGPDKHATQSESLHE